jgi:hypothetical protein
MCTTQVTTSRSPGTGPPTTWGENVRVEDDPREATAARLARADRRGYAEELTDERLLGDELTVEEFTVEELNAGGLTVEEASRLAVTALAADLEFWARAVSVDGWVGVNDLIRTLDLVRETAVSSA